jgi:ATP-dependent helicase HrpB
VLSLPVDSYLPVILAGVESARAVVVVAEPGAGKTTRVPPAISLGGRTILLQPRRMAARAVVRRIAEERGWQVGREVGWQMRFERRFRDDTQLLVATEGILTARLQQDPLLSDFRTVVLDEFHERSLYADLAIALAKQAWLARSDLRLVVMSATIDAEAVAAYLGGCPIVRVPGALHPLRVVYAPGEQPADAAVRMLGETAGDILVFLPGTLEIRRTLAEIATRLDRAGGGPAVDLLPLHGSLDAAEQDRALEPAVRGRRRIIVATNVAETSITVPGVSGVVDSGLHKVARYDAERAVDSLMTERITRDAADQRAGRAARTGPGVVRRLWDERDRLRPHREADIHRVDLAATVLDVLAWGGDPGTLDWFERPSPDALAAAVRLLERLGAVYDGRPTAVGRDVQGLPVHPRLARILAAGRYARPLARACALISERHYIPPRAASTSSDLLSALDRWDEVPPHVKRVADELERVGHAGADAISEEEFRRAILAGYPDRVAARRGAGSDRVKLATGTGAVLGDESGVRDGDFLVAVDVHESGAIVRAGAARTPAGARTQTLPTRAEPRIRIASRVEREWLRPTAVETVHRIDEASGTVRAARIERYDALVLSETPAAVDANAAADLLAHAWLERGLSSEDQQLERRLRFAGIAIDMAVAARRAAERARSLRDMRLADGLDAAARRTLDRDAPEALAVPSGRTHTLEYGEDGTVMASVKLQELFGLSDTPRIGARREPVLLALLAPNGRPVQMTRDLRSFWERTYPEVRKELRGRYPKHPWPEDPWTATPTARAKPRAR